MRKFSIILLIYCSVISCHTSTEKPFRQREKNQHITTIDLHNEEDNAVIPDSIIEIVRYIKPEKTKESLLSSYAKIISSGDTLFILDKSTSQQCIFAFNYHGDFLFKIDAHGNGPNEYKDISDFYVDSKTKHIGILNWSNIHKYNFEGKFIGSLNLSKYNIKNIEFRNNLLYAYKWPASREKMCYAVAVFDLEGHQIYEDYPVKFEFLDYTFCKQNYLSQNSKGTYVNLLNSDTIFEIGSKAIQPAFVLNFGEHRLPDSELDKLLSHEFDYAIDYLKTNHYALFGLSMFYMTDDYIWLCYNVYDGKFFGSQTIIYSCKTGKKKYINSWYPTKEFLLPGNMKNLNAELFYGTVDINQVEWEKKQDEMDGILSPDKKFSQSRLDKYNFIKDSKIDDNETIVLFKIKDF